jgi:serine/threonine-protein kinase
VYDWDQPAAKAEMALASAQQAAVGTLSCTSHLLERTGQPRVAEDMLRRLISYDPESASLVGELGCVQYYRGNYEGALQYYRQAQALNPRYAIPYWGLGKTFDAEGRFEDALEVLRRFRRENGFEPPVLTAEIGYALGASGKKREAMAVVRSLEQAGRTSYVDPYLIALVYLSMGNRRSAFAWLDRAMAAKSPFMISIMTEPKWDPVRDDPRYLGIVGKVLARQG